MHKLKHPLITLAILTSLSPFAFSGSFSETTTASFSVDFLIGAIDGAGIDSSSEPQTATYQFDIDLQTSFTGEDSLDLSYDAWLDDGSKFSVDGLGVNSSECTETLCSSQIDSLKVDGISYFFPVGDATFGVGYSELYLNRGISHPDDNTNLQGALVGASYRHDGFSVAGYLMPDGDNDISAETEDETFNGTVTGKAWGAAAAYSADNYGVAVTYNNVDSVAGFEGGYESDELTQTGVGINAYYSVGDMTLSAAYEVVDTGDDTTDNNFFVGLSWEEVGPGTAMLSYEEYHTIDHAENPNGFYVNAGDSSVYEASYSYPLNDGMTVTPGLLYMEHDGVDETGLTIKSAFSF